MNIVVVLPVNETHKELFQNAAPGEQICYLSDPAREEALIRSADVIIGNVPPAMLQGNESLKWIQLNSAGTDGYTAPGVLPQQAYLTNATGAYGLAISEHMLGTLLFLMKKLNLYHSDQAVHIWGDHGNVTSIWNSRTLVVGLGDIGSSFASRMHALGSQVTGIRKHAAPKPPYLEALFQMDALMEQLPLADIVVSTLPGTPETYHLYDREAFARMKEGAFFLNVGRGNAVDSLALAEALNSGHLAGASVDVTDPEPLPEDHPLWDARNILITPHISGQYHLQETLERIIRISADNLKRFLSGEPLKNQVDFATGYRKFQG